MLEGRGYGTLRAPTETVFRMSADHDPALATLFYPFLTGRISWPNEGALFLRARDGAPLREHPWPKLVCEQTFKPDADALARAGFEPHSEEAQGSYPLVLLLPPRQRDEARALMARAVELTAAGGRVVAAAANNEGARTVESDLRELTGSVEQAVKNKCRVVWTAPLNGQLNRSLLNTWRSLDAPRPVAGGQFVSRPGVFAWDRVDAASALLASHFPTHLAGAAADLGAGVGYLSLELVKRADAINSVDLYEAERRALELARINLDPHASRVSLDYRWHDILSGLPRSYDVIVSNPPFHANSGRARPDIGRRFIRIAAEALRPHGELWLVANRHLPYEDVLDRSFGQVQVIDQQMGFKIIRALKSGSRA